MNFAELRFWGLLGAGLGLILTLRLLLGRIAPRGLATYDRVALATLGLGLLAAVSWLTFAIFVTVLLTAYFGLRWLVTLLTDPAGARRDLIAPTLSLMALLWFLVIGLAWGAASVAYDQVGPGWRSPARWCRRPGPG